MDIKRNEIKILHLASVSQGGAGTASIIFNRYLNDAGYHSVALFRDTNKPAPNTVYYKVKKGGINFLQYSKLKRKYKQDTKIWNELYKANSYTTRVAFDDQKSMATAQEIIKQAGFTPDVIFLHWTNNFVTPEMVAELKEITDAKIIGLMMDNAVFTGGCHYPFDCEGYTSDCTECPMFKKKTTLPADILQRKLSHFPMDMEFWGTTTDCIRVQKSILGKGRKAVPILFPIDTELLPAESKETIREKYKIEKNRKLLLLGCNSFSKADNRKGFEYLVSILTLIKERAPKLQKDISIVIVGEQDSKIFESLNFDVIKLGFIPLKELMKVFKMSDLFLSTSTEDSGPLMVNQSIAMGTPVASFAIGVAQDLVTDNVTGVKADLYDCSTLSNKIIDLLESNRNLGDDCIKIFEQKSQEMSPLVQIERLTQEKTINK